MVKTGLTARQKRGAKAYKIGWWAEVLCALCLTLKGYNIIAYRYKTGLGEIDLIAARGAEVIFVEVKARPNMQKAGEAVSEKQKVRLKRAAKAYLSGRSTLTHCAQRFDVMLVLPWRWPVHLVNAF